MVPSFYATASYHCVDTVIGHFNFCLLRAKTKIKYLVDA